MDRYEAAERIARGIYFFGRNSLSYFEEKLLDEDDELRDLVDSIIPKLQRQEMLIAPNVQRKYPLEIFDKNTSSKFLVQWEFDDVTREAQLWVHHHNDNAVLEIKEWSMFDINNFSQAGAHEIIFQKTIDSKNIIDQLNECKKILAQYKCPKNKIDEI